MSKRPPPPVFTIRDLCGRWCVDRQIISRAIHSKRLPAFKVGGKIWRITQSTVSEIESGQRSLAGRQ